MIIGGEKMSKKPYYEVDGFKLIHGDTFKELKEIDKVYDI